MIDKAMTAEELKARGFCCGSGCKNCPYIPRHARGSILLADVTFKEYYNTDSFIKEQLILEKLIKISGPAIMYKPKKIMVTGRVGTGHIMLWDKLRDAIAKKLRISPDQADDIVDNASEKDIITGFITNDGMFVNREQAWHIAQNYKKNVQAMSAQGVKPELASEYL